MCRLAAQTAGESKYFLLALAGIKIIFRWLDVKIFSVVLYLLPMSDLVW